jgi:hypothetical protein
VIAGGVGLAGLAGYVFYRNRKNAAANAADSASTTDTSGTTTDPNIDPLTGFDYGTLQDQEALAQLNTGLTSGVGGIADTGVGSVGTGTTTGTDTGTDSGDTGGNDTTGDPVTGTPVVPVGSNPTTNAAWASLVEQDLSAIGYKESDVAAAVGRYLGKLSLTTAQANIIRVALAEDGPPPVGTFTIITGSTTTTPPPPISDKGVRQVATGKQSLDAVAKARNTTTAHIIAVTEDSIEISAANRKKFQTYVAGGTNKLMPAGLVYYTSN